MTQLLISVKDVEESLIARYAGVDVIDLKDPNVGALGALDVEVVKEIVYAVDGNTLISATVGEGHQTIDALIKDIENYASLGVDIVKIAVSDLLLEVDFFDEIEQVTKSGIKLVAVFFADTVIDLSLIPKLQKSGFCGVMLDTQLKQHTLLDVQSLEQLEKFVKLSVKHQMLSGLAGSVNTDHVEALLKLMPTFIGLRGGVCQDKQRNSVLIPNKVKEVKNLLLNYNSKQVEKYQTRMLGLHI